MNNLVQKKNRIRIRIVKNKSGELVFKTIINHPMETGYRRDKTTGRKIPADYIDKISVSVDRQTYLEMNWGENVSANPFMYFTFAQPLTDNQLLQISWTDNYQNETAYEFLLNIEGKDQLDLTGEKKNSGVYQLTPVSGPVCRTKLPANRK